jgi:glycosyltransferase involved in cell wall biosynthesis
LGKGDGVRKGLDAAKGDILMILDADLTVAPEDLPNFFWPLAEDKAELVNGCRLVYPMEDEAMRFINLCGNKAFSLAFSWLLEQPIKDTLCGTKALFKRDYERIKANRSYFGEFDPFGDFGLLFGAARLKFRIVDMPIRYRRRVAGLSKVSVFRHGILLVRMVAIGFEKLKLDVWLRRDRGPVHQ